VVRSAMGGARSVVAATGEAEQGGQLRALGSELAKVGGVIGAVTAIFTAGRSDDRATAAEAAAASELEPPDRRGRTPDLVVCASGNLGLIYFPPLPARQTLEEIQAQYPNLVETLARHPGIGCLMVRSGDRGAVVFGPRGTRYLDEGRVEGEDPLAPYGDFAAASLRRLDSMRDCGDLVVISMFDESTGEVAAFEELIGSHGGLGGDQTRAFVLFPSEWPLEGELTGAPQVYRQLRRWLGDLGIELGSRARESAGLGVPAGAGVSAGAAEPEARARSTGGSPRPTALPDSTRAASTSSGPRRT